MTNVMNDVEKETTEKTNLRKLFWIILIMGTALGLAEGLVSYTWGPYLYAKFGGNTDPSGAMMLNTIIGGVIFSLAGTLFEMPAGAIADTIGRAHVVMLSWVFRTVAAALLAVLWLFDSVAWTFSFAVVQIICFTIGYTLFNGAFAAWLADWLKENLPTIHYAWASSRFHSYRSIGKIFGAVFSILMYIKGYAYIAYAVASLFALVGMTFSMTHLKEVKTLNFIHPKRSGDGAFLKQISIIFSKGCRVSFKTPIIFWTLMTYGAYMFLLNMVKYLWPIHLETEWGSQQFAWQWMALVLLPLTLNVFSARYLAWKSKSWVAEDGKHANILQCAYIAAGFCAAGVIITLSIATYIGFNSFSLFFVSIALMEFTFGIVAPVFETLINYFIPPEDAKERATILSAGSMIRSLLMCLLAVPTGGTGGQTTPIFWSIPATLLLICVSITTVVMLRKKKKSSITINTQEEISE